MTKLDRLGDVQSAIDKLLSKLRKNTNNTFISLFKIYLPKLHANKVVTRWVVFISVGEGKCLSEDSFVCFGAKRTKSLRARSPTRPEVDEERRSPS